MSLLAVVDEYFQCGDAVRRRVLERELLDVRNNAASGNIDASIPTLAASSSPYAQFFACVLVQDVCHRWPTLSGENKQFLHNTAMGLMASTQNSAKFVLQKACASLVAVGRAAFPDDIPQFIDTVLGWIKAGTDSNDAAGNGSGAAAGAGGKQQALVGLMVLKMVSEEFSNPGGTHGRPVLTAERKTQLEEALNAKMPEIVAALMLVFRSVAPSLLPFNSSANGVFLPDSAATHPEQHQLVLAALESLQHLLSWIPLKDHVVPFELFEFLFLYAWINGEVGIAALGALVEVLSRHFFPRHFKTFIVAIFQLQMQMFTQLSSAAATGALAEEYLQRIIYFVEIFVRHHLRRILANTEVSTDQYFALLFSFTFAIANDEIFVECLAIWDQFLEDIVDLLSEPGAAAEIRAIMTRYEPGLLALFDALLHKIKFSSNSALLQLDDSSRDEETGLTELGTYQAACNRILEKLIQVYSEPTIGRIANDLAASLESYRSIAALLASASPVTASPLTSPTAASAQHLGSASPLLSPAGAGGGGGASGAGAGGGGGGSASAAPLSPMPTRHELEKARLVLRDVPATLRLVSIAGGRLCEFFEQTYPNANALLHATIDFLDISISSRIIFSCPAPHATHVAAVVKSALGVLHAFAFWLTTANTKQAAGGSEMLAQDFVKVITRITETLAALITPAVQRDVALSAAVYLFSIISTVRPGFLTTLPAIAALINATHTLTQQLATDVSYTLVQSITAALVQYCVAQTKANPASAAQQAQLLSGFVAPFVADLPAAWNFPDAIFRILRILQAVVASVRVEPLESKALVYESVRNIVPQIFAAYPNTRENLPIVTEIVSLFLLMLDTMPSLMGPAMIAQNVSMFLQGFPTTLNSAIALGDEAAQKLINRILDLLSALARDRGQRTLVPEITGLCIELLYPRILNSQLAAEYLPPVYTLVFQLIDTHWRTLREAAGLNERLGKLVFILCSSVSQHSEPSVCRALLHSLSTLNEHHNLFTSDYFVPVTATFVGSLISLLVEGTHNSLHEELHDMVFAIAHRDIASFVSGFLVSYLASIPGLTQDEAFAIANRFSREDDLPTFSSSMDKLVADITFVRAMKSVNLAPLS